MVWVCPPHTSMNLKWSGPLPAKCSMAASSLRAAAGSRNSSTNFIFVPLDNRRRVEGFNFGGVGLAQLLDSGQGEQCLGLVDLGHREPDMDQHPVVGLRHVAFQQPHADRALHTADVYLRQIVGGIGDLNDPTRNPKTHRRSLLSLYRARSSADSRQRVADEHVDDPGAAESGTQHHT